ncbi:MAG: PTS sugar transporter subunit IIA [Candidatus Asgardarchaeia archaeon]
MGKTLSISDVVKPEVIKLKVEVTDCIDAIKKAGRILVEQGIVEERYIEGMIKTFNELGPYIVIAPGVAIPHARPEDGAKKVGLSIMTLKKPVIFGNEENDPVRICIAFASPDTHQHVKILASLANILQSKEDIEAISNAKTPQEVIEIIKKYEV